MTTVTWGALADENGSKMIADASRATLLAATNGNPLSAAIAQSALKAQKPVQGQTPIEVVLASGIPNKGPGTNGPGGLGA